MSLTSIVGGLGVAPQTAKGTPNTTYSWVPATQLGLEAEQQVQQYPLEISGDYISHGSYKTSVSVGGGVSLLVRPDSIGHFLYMLCGQDTVTPVTGQSGAYSHAMSPFVAGSGTNLPWYTLSKNVAGLWAEQYVDTRLSSFQLSIPKAGIVTAQASFFGITPSQVAVPTMSGFDSGPTFETCQATVTLNNEATGLSISADSAYADQIQLSYTSNLSQDEQAVGSFTPIDITLLSRAVSISYDMVIRDAALREAVYQNGASTNWSPQVYRGSLTVVLNSSTNIGATTQPYTMTITIPGMDFLLMPIQMSGAQLIRANLSAVVTLGPSGNDHFSFTTVNATASY